MTLNSDIQGLIDEAMLAEAREEAPRTYLGASGWGEECARKLAYKFHQTPMDGLDARPAHVLRIADMGHELEDLVAGYLRKAGFTLQSEDPATGEQWEFWAAQGKLGGHCDGKILAGPLDLPYPLIWENKALNDSGFNAIVRDGLMSANPIYWGQLQTYMAYLEVPNGALFTVINRNTGKIHAEIVEFMPEVAQMLSDRALRVVQTRRPEEMPQVSSDPSNYRCSNGFCEWQKRCHGITEMEMTKPVRTPYFPAWIKPPQGN